MASTIEPSVYKDALVVLATAGVIVPFAKRLKVNSIVAFMACGALLGPFGLGGLLAEMPFLRAVTVSDPEALAGPAEIGVAFLLFVIGLELSPERLLTMRRLVFGLGLGQVALSAGVIGAIAYVAGQPAAASLLIGFGLALSSTAMVVELLSGQRRMMSTAGRGSFAILLCQDIAVVPLLFLIAVLGAQSGGSLITGLLTALAHAVLVIAAIVLIGRLLLRPLFRLVASTDTADSFLAATLLVALGTGLVAASAGLSMGLGAFIAGLLLAESEYRRALEVTIEPFKSLLIGVFFITVGMGLNPLQLAAEPVAILAVALGLLAVKVVVVWLLARAFGLSAATAIEVAILVAPGGEFAFVLLRSAADAKLLAPDVEAIVLAAVSLTMISLPLCARLGRRLAGAVAKPAALPAEALVEPPSDHAPHAIVVGCGRVGRLVGDMLAKHDMPYLAIDADPARIAAERRAGRPCFYGNGAQPEFLRSCGLLDATALIVTIDVPHAIDETVKAARAMRPDLVIVARARDARHARHLYEIGVNDVVPETIEASLQLSEAALVGLGVPMGLVIASIHQRRDDFRAELKPADGPQRPVPRHARSRRL